METNQTNLASHSHLGRIAFVVALILMIPLVAMQFTDEVAWGPLDFIIMGTLLFGTGLGLDLIGRKVRRITSRIALSVLAVTILLLIWVELAVGIFGTPFAGQ